MFRFFNYLVRGFFPDIKLALTYLAHHSLRTFLTMLGMIFGVGAVIAMLAVSEGGRIEALKKIEGLGVRNLIIQDESPTDESLLDVRQHSAGLSVADAGAIADTIPSIETWAGIRTVPLWDRLFSPDGSSTAEVWAVSPDFFDLSSLEPSVGTIFDADDDDRFAQKAVLGDTVARDLFPQGEAVGQRIKINHMWVEVIGVLLDRQLENEEFQGFSVGGEGDRVYIPLQTGLKRMQREEMDAELSQLKMRVSPEADLGSTAAAVETALRQRHVGQLDFSMVVPARLLAQQRQTQQIFTIVMCVVAGISLVVGGIGIMNIMLACVLERRSEIGLLRAVGAKRADVVRQFLTETIVIAFLGAVLGIIAGVAIAYGVSIFSKWAVAWSLPGIVVAVVVCATIAVAFGVYPAMAAAKLDPVVALQSE